MSAKLQMKTLPMDQDEGSREQKGRGKERSQTECCDVITNKNNSIKRLDQINNKLRIKIRRIKDKYKEIQHNPQ